jgi:cytidyltransferase-like protein
MTAAERLTAPTEPALTLRWVHEPAGDPGRRVVATGVFDVLHVGHARFLAAARAAGDSLVVGVESDARVAARKGPPRPIVPAEQRAELLEAFAAVDGVFIVEGPSRHMTPPAYAELLAPLRPALLALTEGDKVERGKREAASMLGAGVVVVPLVAGLSTTRLYERIADSARTA